jgi:acetyltransferase-like isoleucine patch superfamily enzyme
MGVITGPQRLRRHLAQLALGFLPNVAAALRRRWLVLVNEPGAIRFEGPVYLGPGLRVRMSPGAKLVLGANTELRHRITLEVGGELRIGEGTVLTYGVVIQCVESISIGRDCMIGTYCSIVDANHRFRERVPHLAWQHLETRPVRVGDEVLVNTKATIAADVGDRSVVAAHAVVVDPLPADRLAGGLPAKVLANLGGSEKRPPSGAQPAVSRASE